MKTIETKKKPGPKGPAPTQRKRKKIPAKAQEKDESEGSSSLSRMLGTLQLFSKSEPVLSAEQIAQGAGVPTSTAYRYVKQLTNVGLLVRWKGGFALGPRIIELDLLIRECDPVIIAAAEPMQELSHQTGLDILLTKIYARSIMTVHVVSTGNSRVLNFGRGRPLPLFRGSSSKAIMAFLPAARLRRMFNESQSSDAGSVRQGWSDFYASMSRIRKMGYSLTKGELNSGIEGISAPIFANGRDVIGSLTLIGDVDRMGLLREDAVVERLRKTVTIISAALR